MQNAAEVSVRSERTDQGWLDLTNRAGAASKAGLKPASASAGSGSAGAAVVVGILLAGLTGVLGAIISSMTTAAILGIAAVFGSVVWRSSIRSPAWRAAVDRLLPSGMRLVQMACVYLACLLPLIASELIVSGEFDVPLAWSAIAGFFILMGLSLLLLRERLQALLRRKTVVVIGGKERARPVSTWLVANDPYSVIVGIFDPSGDKPARRDGTELDAFARGAREGRCSHVILALEGQESSLPVILDRLAPLALDVRNSVTARGGGYALVRLQGPALGRWQRALKATVDYTLATAALIVLAPVMVLIAIAVKVDSPGPVIFVQPRGGLRRRTFNLFKFRTMSVMETGEDVVQAREADPRITRVGAFLRRTSLDELPQLLNILRGELSLVGPRPHALAHDRYYGELIEHYALRQRVKPGITGWAQVNGCRGETRDPNKMRCRVEHDLAYIGNWSLWLDVRILLRTVAIALWDPKAF